MRKKLVSLIREITPYWAEVIADYLITKGWTNPVRCKDCKYYGSVQEPCHGRTQRFCGLHKGLVVVDRDTFCSYGVRRTDDK